MRNWKTSLTLVIVLSELIGKCTSDGIMEMLSQFMDLEELAEEAAKDMADDSVDAEPVDTAYPLARVEMETLLQLYRDCRSNQSTGLRTWCIGDEEYSYLDDGYHRNHKSCPHGVLTHPCTGRVLLSNKSVNDEDVVFLWPWEGIRCDPHTDPTTVTHMYAHYVS